MAIPAWMMDKALCAGHFSGSPEVSLAALNHLEGLIRALKADTPSEVNDAPPLKAWRDNQADDVNRAGASCSLITPQSGPYIGSLKSARPAIAHGASTVRRNPTMTKEEKMSSKITPEHQSRTAIVYVRQSTSFQIAHNVESQRRQYGLVEYATTVGLRGRGCDRRRPWPNRVRAGGAARFSAVL